MTRSRQTFPVFSPRPDGVMLGVIACLVGIAATTVLPSGIVRPLMGEEPVAATGSSESLGGYLSTWKIDRDGRRLLEEPGAWDEARQALALRVLTRLVLAPPKLAVRWNEDAVPVAGPGQPAEDAGRLIGNAMIRATGRAVFVAPQVLPPAQAEIFGRPQIDVVRIVTPAGLVLDVLTDAAPRSWPRWKAIDESAAVVGLPLAAGSGPRPGPPPADGVEWPAQSAGLLLAATRVSWFPPTPLGGLGLDYGLFDTVVDGQRLVAGDTEAFYGMLAAVGRGTEEGIEAAAGPPRDVVPLIDPRTGWFGQHRGEPLTVDGIARRATRIEVDDPVRRRQIGTDHYWELFVFVETSLIKINEHLQESYPIVCCVRTLPDGMPTGQSITERVRVSGFAMKRYGYPLPKLRGADGKQGEERRETPLLIGKQAVWLPAPSPASAASLLGWVFTGLAGIIGLLLAVGVWSFSRAARRKKRLDRETLPDRLQLPGAGD